MHYDMKQSGLRIQQLRIQNGYTQEALAEMLNIDRSFYGRIEAGKRGCSVDLFVQLSVLFNVSLDYLILGKYSEALLESADRAQMKDSLKELIYHLEQFSAAI